MSFSRRVAIVGISLLALVVGPVWAQSNAAVHIKGTVVDDSTGAPLPATHVFVSGSMAGTTVDRNGDFELTDLSVGAKELYVTHLGYKAEKVSLLLQSDTTLTLHFRLKPTVLEKPAVTISAERDDEWYEKLERFERLFIGETAEADRCRLVNPTVLRFDTAWWGKFEADAARPLILENRALGYRVAYYLKEFEEHGDIIRWDGNPIYEPLAPTDSAEADRWSENRRRAFRGSLRHFLLALIHDRLEEENFRIYRIPRARAFRRVGRAKRIAIDRDNILSPASDSLYQINFRGTLEVRYDGEAERQAYLEWANLNRSTRDHQVSHIELNERPIHVDRHGEIVEPYGATLRHYFAFTRRLSTLLPREYRPPETTLSASTPSTTASD